MSDDEAPYVYIIWSILVSEVSQTLDGRKPALELNPQGEIKKSAPGGGFVLSGRLTRGRKSHRSPKSDCLKELFTLLDVRPENQVFVIILSTNSMSELLNLIFG